MTSEQHPEATKATTEELRARLHLIAAQNEIEIPEPDEPLDELLERIRTQLQDEFERMSDHYSDLDAELDEIEGLLTDQADADDRSDATTASDDSTSEPSPTTGRP